MPAAEQAPADLDRTGFPRGKHTMSLLRLSWPPWSSTGRKLLLHSPLARRESLSPWLGLKEVPISFK